MLIQIPTHKLQQDLERLFATMKQRNLTLSSAESCTGGLFSALITSLSGSSSFFKGGVIAYDNRIKTDLLNVPESLIADHGAVSNAVAEAMARGGLRQFHSDICIAVTGVAGPTGGSKEKPVGTVWSALGYRDTVSSRLWHLSGDRTDIRSQSCVAMIEWLLERFDTSF